MDIKFSDISHKGFGKAERVYLFHGPEDALKRKAVEMFIAAFVDKDTRDFDCEIRDGTGATADRDSCAGPGRQGPGLPAR